MGNFPDSESGPTADCVLPLPGAHLRGRMETEFIVWAPFIRNVTIRFPEQSERTEQLQPFGDGTHRALVNHVPAGTLYLYELDGAGPYPDPASRRQPQGVLGPSQVIDPFFEWKDSDWSGVDLGDLIFYEIHVGTFSSRGDFQGVREAIDSLLEIGINAIQLMPLAQFPGQRNWGYDGVFPFAVQDSYGRPRELKELIDHCHRRGMAVFLDLVLNHLGPEGNIFARYGPYFTDRYVTPWGDALNFDGPDSDGVRHFFISNALAWLDEFHFDGLRLDAVHAIYDASPLHLLEELALTVRGLSQQRNRQFRLIAESDRNDPRLIRSPAEGGYGLDAVWCDDFHHSLHALLTGERHEYYSDFGRMEHLLRAWREGFVYSGEYSRYHRRRQGRSARGFPPSRFVVFAQNHDQVGNRPRGRRLSNQVSFDLLKLKAGIVLLSPYIPLLFMGEEYGETAPFLYFIDHQDPALLEAVRAGRSEEFRSLMYGAEPPDPAALTTYTNSIIDPGLKNKMPHRILFSFYRELLALRRELKFGSLLERENMSPTCSEEEKYLVISSRARTMEMLLIFNLNRETIRPPLADSGTWRKRLDSADKRWRGSGALLPESFSNAPGETLPVPGSSMLVLIQKTE